mgnify:CR=1 FL=1
MSCARNQILQMLVRLTGPPRPRVSAAALNSSPILTEQIIMGTMRYSRIEPAFPPPKRTPRIRMRPQWRSILLQPSGKSGT